MAALCVIMKFKEFDEKYGEVAGYSAVTLIVISLMIYFDVMSWSGLGILVVTLAGLISFIVVLKAIILPTINISRLTGKPKLIFWCSLLVSIICVPLTHYFISYEELYMVYVGLVLITIMLLIQWLNLNKNT